MNFYCAVILISFAVICNAVNDGRWNPSRDSYAGKYKHINDGRYVPMNDAAYRHVHDRRELGFYQHVHIPYDGGYGPYFHVDNPYAGGYGPYYGMNFPYEGEGSFETENGIFAQENAAVSKKSDNGGGTAGIGYYQYIGDDDKVYRVDYEVGPQGFIPRGDHIHPAILNSLKLQQKQDQLPKA